MCAPRQLVLAGLQIVAGHDDLAVLLLHVAVLHAVWAVVQGSSTAGSCHGPSAFVVHDATATATSSVG